MLPDFLAAVDGLWDQFIAVDTGSVDGSAALLEKAGAQVVSFPWVDDFSAARNASLNEATGSWILFLDADERPGDQLKGQIRALLDDPQAGAATLVMRNRLPGGHVREGRLLRLFRNDPSLRFRYRIHEDVSEAVADFLRRNNLRLRHLPGVAEHLGYTREVAASRDKKERDLALLNLSLDQDPDDFYCRYKIMEIARFWDDRDLWLRQARLSAELLAELSPGRAADLKLRPWSGELAALVVQGLGLGSAESLAWLEQNTAWCDRSAAWLFKRATLLEEMDRLDEAEFVYRQCLEVPDEASTQLVGTRPLLGLCRLALARGESALAAQLALQAADLAPLDGEALLALITSAELQHSTAPLTAHAGRHPQAALPLARDLLGRGQAAPVRELLKPLAAENPDAAIGLLVSCLVLGEEFEVEVEVDEAAASDLLRQWVRCLWQSRDSRALGAFADNCGSITGWFPWLPGFLGEETRRLSARQD